MTTSQWGPLSSHAINEDPEVRRKTGVQSLDSSQSINQHLDTKARLSSFSLCACVNVGILMHMWKSEDHLRGQFFTTKVFLLYTFSF